MVSGLSSRVSGLGSRALGLGCWDRVSDFGCRDGLGFRVLGLEFWGSGIGYWVSGPARPAGVLRSARRPAPGQPEHVVSLTSVCVFVCVRERERKRV